MFDLNFTLWHSAESQIKLFFQLRAMPHGTESELFAMRHSEEFFSIVWNRNKILSAFTEAVKVTVYQKIGHR
jgi:hypothetical protein